MRERQFFMYRADVDDFFPGAPCLAGDGAIPHRFCVIKKTIPFRLRSKTASKSSFSVTSPEVRLVFLSKARVVLTRISTFPRAATALFDEIAVSVRDLFRHRLEKRSSFAASQL